MQVAREAVVRLCDELDRVRADHGEGVSLEGPNAGDPQEAVLASLAAQGPLGQHDSGAAVGEGVDSRRLVDAVGEHASEPDQAVDGPCAGNGDDDVQYHVLELGPVQRKGDDGDYE